MSKNKKPKKTLISRIDEKFKKILEKQIYIGYLTYISLNNNEFLSYEEYLVKYKDILKNKGDCLL